MGGFPDDQAVIISILPQMADPVALFEFEIDDLTVSFIDFKFKQGNWICHLR
jgi:hypothetical protein